MNHHPSPRRRYTPVVLATVLAAVLLTGCSSKPPGCADEQTVGLAKEIILDSWKELTTTNRPQDEFSPYVAAYANGLKVEVRNIVSDGYNSEARKHSCTGEIALKTMSGATFTATRNFTSQATADGNKKFVVQVAAVEPLVRSLTNDLLQYMSDENQKRLDAKKAEALKRPSSLDQPQSIAPIDQAAAESTPPASPTQPPQPQPQLSQEVPQVETRGPSFDCAKADTPVERAICGDPKLANLDAAMANAYRVALSKSDNKPSLRTQQATWRDMVRNECTSVQCLADAYQRRIAQLQ